MRKIHIFFGYGTKVGTLEVRTNYGRITDVLRTNNGL